MRRRRRGSIITHILCHIIILDAFTTGGTGCIQEEEEEAEAEEEESERRGSLIKSREFY
jgi:hypothetical protein